MSYQILPNIIFILAVAGALVLILKRLPEATAKDEQTPNTPLANEILAAKGLPAQAISKIRVTVIATTKKIWNFILEAKDLKPHAAAGYRMKKIFGGTLAGFKKPEARPLTTHEVKNEQYYLDMIKIQPRNLSHYDALGKFYLSRDNYGDAKDIYQYLVNHEPTNPEFQARLAYCFYQQDSFDKAAEHYQKSLGLDSTQPNRYYNLGLSLEKAGDIEGAAKAFIQALTLEPASEKYRQALENLEKL